MRIWLFLTIAFVLNACSSAEPTVKLDKPIAYPTISQSLTVPPQNPYISAIHSGAFQKPGELEPAVEFWRKTYAVWHRSEVAFHDDRYLDVIYEVMVLPSYVDESLTSEQKEMINQRRDFWKAQLSVLESKLLYNMPLDANDRQMIAKLESSGRKLNSILNGAAERVRWQRGTRERFKHGLEISHRYDRQFRKIFRDAGLPEDLAYLPHVESSFQPTARSSAGAVGMWQFTKAAANRFMPAGHRPARNSLTGHRPTHSRLTGHRRVDQKPTGHRLADIRIDQRLDPFASAIGAARYLSYAYGKLGDWPTAITSYNHGISGMKRAQDQVGRDFVRIVEAYDGPAFGFASRNYYAQFLAAREIASNPTQYFSEGLQYEPPLVSSQYMAVE
ncbi:MAG: lytic transglycosylase domain-containing protein [Methylobacter sp.]|nr:lytic transglycosylase domain-containing protein [Methylobacter sp.]